MESKETQDQSNSCHGGSTVNGTQEEIDATNETLVPNKIVSRQGLQADDLEIRDRPKRLWEDSNSTANTSMQVPNTECNETVQQIEDNASFIDYLSRSQRRKKN